MPYVFALVALALLIVVHEAGHMWVARWSGMRVEKFSIFFGPALASWRRKGTTYQIAAIPLGGFVQVAGMNPHDGVAADDPGSYQNKPAWQRFLTILAGPAINYLFAMVLVLVVLMAWGRPQPTVAIGEVLPDSPAAVAGMRSGDEILAVAGTPVKAVDDVVRAVSASGGEAVSFELRRDGKKVTLAARPTKQEGSYRIGIRFGTTLGFRPAGLGEAVLTSISHPFAESGRVLQMLKRLVTREVSTKHVGGPIEIVYQIKSSFDGGLPLALFWMAQLNIYLGLFNLLPLPALDGGRLAFLGIEMVTRRRVNPRLETIVHAVGFVLLFGLLLLVTYGDIKRRLF